MASARKPEPLSEEALVTRLEQMNRQAVGHTSDEVSQDQDDNLERYLGMPYGDEEDGRSRAISNDVAEVVDWAICDILEPYISGDKVVEFVPGSKQEEAYAERATDLVNHVFYTENDGVTFLHDVVKTAAIQKVCFSKTVWQEEEKQERETVTGVSIAHLEELRADKTLTIEDVEAEPLADQIQDQQALAAYADGQVYTVTYSRAIKSGCNKIIAIPPEQVKFSSGAASVADVDYIAHEIETNRSKLYEMGFDAEKVEQIGARGSSLDDNREDIRFHDESRRENDGTQHASDKVTLVEEYPLVDANGDGKLERLQVFRVGKVILQREEVSEHPFDAWSPDRIPHRLVGLAIADKVKQTAYIKTHLTRQLLDNVYLANNPRIEVPDQAMGEDTIADLLTYRVGGLIRTKGNGQMLRPIEIPDRSNTALQAIVYMDQVREQQSGITKNGMAVSSEMVDPKSATESRRQDRNEQVRKRLMTRMLGQTFLVGVFRKLLKNCVRYQDAAKEIQVRGSWTMVDVRGWNADMKARVTVGLGYANRDEMMQGAMMVGQAQQLGAEAGIVQPKHLYKTASKLVEAAGLGFPEDYFDNPDTPEWQEKQAQKASNPPQDPKMVEAQGKLQIKQTETQIMAQMREQEIAHKAQIAEIEAQSKFQIAQLNARLDYALGKAQLVAETQLSRDQMQAEQELAEWETRQNVDIKRKQAASRPTASGSNGSSVRFGGAVG